jgi:Ca2+-binding RTX toxin-like protein
MTVMRTAVIAGTVVGGLLAIPAHAGAEVDSSSLSDFAEIFAEGFAAGQAPEQTVDSSSDFSEFLSTVRARDSSANGRDSRARVIHDTEIVRVGGEVLGFDSSAEAEANVNDPGGGDDGLRAVPARQARGLNEPFGRGESTLEVDFDVVNAPVEFVLAGTAEVSGNPGTNQACAALSAEVFDDPTTISSGCGSDGPTSLEFDDSFPLEPGSHHFELDLFANAVSFGGSTAETARAAYDIQLRFCSIVAEAGVTQGTEGDDVICGTSAAQTILGNGGNDRIFGFGGGDMIDGGTGNDDLQGGDGDDPRIYGGLGDDVINAGDGNDGQGGFANVVAGGAGNDEIDGGAGNDTIFGRCGEGTADACPADPPVSGESDDDNLSGGFGEDALDGDGGTNLISGGNGRDAAFAGDLGDTIVLGDGPDVAVGGAGNDEIDGGPGNENVPNVGLSGGGGRDEINGGAGNDLLLGDQDDDDLRGEAGADELLGDDGDDCLVGGSKRDVIEGRADDDTILAKDGAKDAGSGGTGPDRGRFDPNDSIASVQDRTFQGGC